MKTRRILAASTAALLAFGTTAIVSTVASAADLAKDATAVKGSTAVTKVTLTKKAPAVITASSTEAELTAAVDVKGFVVTVGEGEADADGNKPLTYDTAETATDVSAKCTLTVSGSAKTKWTVTATYVDVDKTTGKGVEKKESIDLAISNYEGGNVDMRATAGSELTLCTGITAKIDKTTKVAKAFDKYEMNATKYSTEPDGSGDDATVNTDKTAIIKELNDDLKEEFAEMKASEVQVLEVNLIKGNYKEATTPDKNVVTVKVTTDFKPMYVYHVVGNEVELVRRVEAQKVTTSDKYETTFNTTKFSPFILTTTKLENAGVQDDEVDPDAIESKTSNATSAATSAATSNAGTSTNPETGIALAIAPVVLAAGAVAVVALKKKH